MLPDMFETISGLGVEASLFRGSIPLHWNGGDGGRRASTRKGLCAARGAEEGRGRCASEHAASIAFWRPRAAAWCLSTFAAFLCVCGESSSMCLNNRPLAIPHTHKHTHTHTHTHTGLAAPLSLPLRPSLRPPLRRGGRCRCAK
jgi:hypothetical protein